MNSLIRFLVVVFLTNMSTDCRFYRYVGASEVSFSPSGALSAPRALFSGLPSKQLLTLSLQPPDSWMIEPVTALYDLDNIKMEQVGKIREDREKKRETG